MARLLVAEDDFALRKLLIVELSGEGHEVIGADNGLEALEILDNESIDVVILDLKLPGLDGIEVLKRIRELDIPVESVVLTAFASVSSAVEAMKMGAYDYITKPFKLDEVKIVIRKACERKHLITENLILKTQIEEKRKFPAIITADPQMLGLLEKVKKISPTPVSILIIGESGVGKELLARAIHEASDRSAGPFVAINCGSIPSTMLENELFGHEKGGYTGADARKLGLLEIAHSGTVLLDEIGEMPYELQVKLLRVIETKKFYRIGGTRETEIDVRFISATNKDIEEEIRGKHFRSDLFYRLGGVILRVPPLRERKADIPLLIRHFLAAETAYKNKQFTGKALEALSASEWPGNVRELYNIVQSIVLLSNKDSIDLEDLPPFFGLGRKIPFRSLDEIEREHILQVLRQSGGHRGKAAEILGIDPKTLYRKLKKFKIEN